MTTQGADAASRAQLVESTAARLEELAPDDGFTITTFELADHSYLYMSFRIGGNYSVSPGHGVNIDADMRVMDKIELDKCKIGESPEAMGPLLRREQLAKAIARYLNTGGTLTEVSDLLRAMLPIVGDPDARLHLFPGFEYVCTSRENPDDHFFLFPGVGVGIQWSADEFRVIDVVEESRRLAPEDCSEGLDD